MYLEHLSLVNFKNSAEAEFEFSPRVNCFLGDNGEGKTNILDAIHYLSFCKSYFNPIDSQNIRHEENFFVIQGRFSLNEEPVEVYCGQKKGAKKSFRKNKKEYARLSDHIGLFPLVMISPSDSDLINEGSEVRRRFVDSIISQYDKSYLDRLIEYNKVLTQRNALLKRFADSNTFSADLLEAYDYRMIELAQHIYESRNKFIWEFIGLFVRYFQMVSGGKEEVGIVYRSDLSEGDFAKTLKNSLGRDRASTFSQVGTHKDDLIFTMNDQPVKKFGSQGQQKSYLIGLKLAQYYYISKVKSLAPILLLDDIFDKLDEKRIKSLMNMVTGPDFGQVFITDTSSEKLPELLEDSSVDFRKFSIREGSPE